MRLRRVLVALGVLTLVGALGWAALARREGRRAATTAQGRKPKRPPGRILVAVTDSGGGWAGIVANDGERAGKRSRFSAAGLDVEVRLIRGAKERLALFDAGELDVLALPLDAFALLLPAYRKQGVELRAFLVGGLSHGSIGLAAAGKPRSLESLKDARIATIRGSSAQLFLQALLDRAGLSDAERARVRSQLQLQPRAQAAVELFRRGEAEAIAAQQPFLDEAVQGGKGRILITTASADELEADVLFARADFLAGHAREMTAFTRAWLEGAALIQNDTAGSARTLSRALQLPEPEVQKVLARVQECGFAENRRFFGLAGERSPYQTLFSAASAFGKEQGSLELPSEAGATRWLDALEALQPAHGADELPPRFRPAGKGAKGAAVLTRNLLLPFGSGDEALDAEAARPLLDELAEALEPLGNTWIKVEVTADARGPFNYQLAKKRAQVVVDALVTQEGIDRARFVTAATLPDDLPAAGSDAPRPPTGRTAIGVVANE